MIHPILGPIINNRNTGIPNKVITHCPFCQVDLIAYDETYDLYTCRKVIIPEQGSHYQVYYYGSKQPDTGEEEFQEMFVFDNFALVIEHPIMEWELKINTIDDNTIIYPVDSFPIKNYEELKQKLETYITFL